MPIFCLFQVVASLVYADNGASVEKPKDDAEAPLLISYDGVEFPSTHRPIKLLNGRASFKLKISQVSIIRKLFFLEVFIIISIIRKLLIMCDPNYHQYFVVCMFIPFQGKGEL